MLFPNNVDVDPVFASKLKILEEKNTCLHTLEGHVPETYASASACV
jgi:hypothetical protein